MTNIFAAVHQLDNDRRSERTTTGMQAAAALGRWPFKAPIGYRNVHGSNKGPNIIPDEKTSGLVRQGFELMATGLQARAEVLRAINKLGLETAKGKQLSAQTFQKMLLNPIYAGWVVIPEWDVMERGSFEPLVSQDLFDKVQDVLSGRRPNLTAYQRNRAEFPLRLFVRCAHCGVPLTSSVSKGRREKYPYYRCRKRGCYGVSNISPDDLHSNFLLWLQRTAPKPEAMVAIKDSIRTVWQQRQGDAEQLRSALARKLELAKSRKDTLVKRWTDNQVDQKTFSEYIPQFTAEIEAIQEEIRSTEVENIELERVLEFADRIILRPTSLWVESSLDQRQRLQKTLFPNGIEFDGEEFGTAATSLFFNLIEPDPNDSWGLASPTGFEPVLSP
jgi:site-specific DNA recombinase